jgi:predicted PP-loop superfamily ATPase
MRIASAPHVWQVLNYAATSGECNKVIQMAIAAERKHHRMHLGDQRMKTPVVMSWSGGKDSALALHELRMSGQYEVVALMTSISEEYHRISHHGVREDLLERQAVAIGIPLEKIYLPSGKSQPCTNEVYEQVMGDVMAKFYARGVRTVAFGDLFLEELRSQQETNQILQGQELQLIVGQKMQQDNLKTLFQTGSTYQDNFNFLTPQQTSAGTQWAFHY